MTKHDREEMNLHVRMMNMRDELSTMERVVAVVLVLTVTFMLGVQTEKKLGGTYEHGYKDGYTYQQETVGESLEIENGGNK